MTAVNGYVRGVTHANAQEGHPHMATSEHDPEEFKGRAHSIDAFCNRNGLGRSFVYGEIRAGNLIARKAGRRTLILPDDEARYLASLPAMGPATAA